MPPRTWLVVAAFLMSALPVAQVTGRVGGQSPAPSSIVPKIDIPFADARPLLETWGDQLPGELHGLGPGQREAAWPAWVRRRDSDIRTRLEQGDHDSLVNLWLFGTSFTEWPRAAEPDMTELRGTLTPTEIVTGRLEDLVAGIVTPGANERLRFARDVIERQGIDPATAAGRDEARRFLIDARQRALEEHRAHDEALKSAAQRQDQSSGLTVVTSLFRDRGLSSDTSILAGYGVEQALRAMAAGKVLPPGSVRRVGIIGPGLDFTNKADGHDFYPQQSIQPFAVIDSLMRAGLAASDDLAVTTFDLSPRVNRHLTAARDRARAGHAYPLHLPLHRAERWRFDLLAYRARFGDGIGAPVSPAPAPWAAGAVTARAIGVRPDVVLSILPRDLNVVLERLAPLPSDEQFDLIVGTNVLVYYSPFEQSLALSNIAAMLRPGGLFLTNHAVLPIPPFQSTASHLTVVYSDEQSDHLFWYQRD